MKTVFFSYILMVMLLVLPAYSQASEIVKKVQKGLMSGNRQKTKPSTKHDLKGF